MARMTKATAVPVALLLVGIVSVQYGATFARGMFPVVGASGTTALRLLLASVMLTVALRPWRVHVPARMLPRLLGYGVSLGAMNLLFYLSLRTVPLGIAVALEFIGPLAVTLSASRRWIDVGWMGLAAAGLALLLPIGGSWHGIAPADALMAVGAGVGWGIYIVCGRSVGAVLGTPATAFGTLIGMVVILPIGLAHAGAALFAPRVLLSGAVVAFFSSALPYSVDMVAMTRLSPLVFGTLTSLDPAAGALMGVVFLHQSLTVLQWLGVVAVALAAAGATATTGAEPIVAAETPLQ